MTFKNEIKLDDLALFLTISETGNFTAASQHTGVPLPTVSRRMRQLESDLDRALFERNKPAITLTEDGRSLAVELRGLNEVRNRLRRWRDETNHTPFVRITAGDWTTSYLAGHLPKAANWRPAFMTTTANLDIARREADIGIRSATPDHPWLASKKLRPVTYAEYGTDQSVAGYIGPASPENAGPSQRWLMRHHAHEITATATTPQATAELAKSGLGRVILPTFTGDKMGGLTRLSSDINDLTHNQWIVTHQDARYTSPIRAAFTVICSLLAD